MYAKKVSRERVSDEISMCVVADSEIMRL